MSVHISDDGMSGLTLAHMREFVRATKDYPPDTRLKAGVVGLVGTSIGYTMCHGIETMAHTNTHCMCNVLAAGVLCPRHGTDRIYPPGVTP